MTKPFHGTKIDNVTLTVTCVTSAKFIIKYIIKKGFQRKRGEMRGKLKLLCHGQQS